MASQVKVTSVDALAQFRSSAIIFMTRARRAMDMAGDEVKRTRQWIQTDQRMHWEGQLKQRRRRLDQANGELLSASLSEFNDSASMQKQAVRKAKRDLDEAEEKLRNLKKWSQNFDHYADPMIRRIDNFRQFLDHVMPNAIAYLEQAQHTLESYAEIRAPGAAAPPVIVEEGGGTQP
jgi:hypothetical protein